MTLVKQVLCRIKLNQVQFNTKKIYLGILYMKSYSIFNLTFFSITLFSLTACSNMKDFKNLDNPRALNGAIDIASREAVKSASRESMDIASSAAIDVASSGAMNPSSSKSMNIASSGAMNIASSYNDEKTKALGSVPKGIKSAASIHPSSIDSSELNAKRMIDNQERSGFSNDAVSHEADLNVSGWYLQVLADTNRSAVSSARQNLVDLGYKTSEESAVVHGQKFHRLLVGPFKTKVEAKTKINDLKNTGVGSDTPFMRHL